MKDKNECKTFLDIPKYKNNNILYLKKMGCDFSQNDEISKVSDLNNYRYFIYDIELYNDIKCNVIEVSAGARYKTINGRLKNIDGFGLWIQTYYLAKGGIKSLSDIETKLNMRNFSSSITYTKKDLLRTINKISKIKYNEIEIIER